MKNLMSKVDEKQKKKMNQETVSGIKDEVVLIKSNFKTGKNHPVHSE